MTTQHTRPDGLVFRSSNIGSPSGGADVSGKHHKPPYNSPDPFRYRTLTYVQLGRDPGRFNLRVICKRLQMARCRRSFRFVLENAP
jgi:hypothetical protein